MYQEDIQGKNAIDIAFEKNSIFSIKIFVDNLLELADRSQFRNSFDKALLLMIMKGMDVKELVNSNLFYSTIWNKYIIFSQVSDIEIAIYNNSLQDLELDDPFMIFNKTEKGKAQQFDTNNKSKAQKDLIKRREERMKHVREDQLFGKRIKGFWNRFMKGFKRCIMGEIISDFKEQHEMQFNYIYLGKIQTKEKINLIKVIKDAEDLQLFEQEPIQVIIDYKWNTYTKNFFLFKMFIYLIYLTVFYLDIEDHFN
jgi:hypothetical protein